MFPQGYLDSGDDFFLRYCSWRWNKVESVTQRSSLLFRELSGRQVDDPFLLVIILFLRLAIVNRSAVFLDELLQFATMSFLCRHEFKLCLFVGHFLDL